MSRTLRFLCFVLPVLWLIGCVKSQEEIMAEKMARNAAFRNAAAEGDLKEVRRLLTEGADLNSADEQGITAMMKGARSGDPEMVRELVSRGAGINDEDKRGRTALLFAVSGTSLSSSGSEDQRESAVREILQAGADIHAHDNKGKSAIVEAATWTTPEILNELLRSGADLESADSSGMTALMWAANQTKSARDTTENVRFLVKAGARINVRSENGWKALDYAEKRGNNQAVIDILREAETEEIARTQPLAPKPPERTQEDVDKAIGELFSLGTQALKSIQKSQELKEMTQEMKSTTLPAEELNMIQISCSRDPMEIACLVKNDSSWIIEELLIQFHGTTNEGVAVTREFTLVPSHPLNSGATAVIKRRNTISARYDASTYSVSGAVGSKTAARQHR